jgi:hypothetical protein
MVLRVGDYGMLRLKSTLLGTATLAICSSCGGGSSSPGPSTAVPSSAAEGGSTEIDDSDTSVIFSRGNNTAKDWDVFNGASEDYQQDEHSSSFVRGAGAVTGAGVVVNFTGTGISWIGKKGPQYGIASYSIDGGAPKTVDNYDSTAKNQNANVIVSGLNPESHVLSISLTDKKNAASSDYWQTIDAFTIEGSTLTPSQGTIAGYNSPDLKFTGTWGGGQVSDDSDLSGGHYWSNQTNASLSWTFVGSLIEVFGRPDYENGYMDVYIDSGSSPVASINGHWGMVDDDMLNAYMLFAMKLAPGTHTIKLVVAGKHDGTARDNYVQIDELLAFQ